MMVVAIFGILLPLITLEVIKSYKYKPIMAQIKKYSLNDLEMAFQYIPGSAVVGLPFFAVLFHVSPTIYWFIGEDGIFGVKEHVLKTHYFKGLFDLRAKADVVYPYSQVSYVTILNKRNYGRVALADFVITLKDGSKVKIDKVVSPDMKAEMLQSYGVRVI